MRLSAMRGSTEDARRETHEPTNEAVIDHAPSVLNAKMVGDRFFGGVGCALITRDGNLYLIPRREWS
jgi:hypothetical protein